MQVQHPDEAPESTRMIGRALEISPPPPEHIEALHKSREMQREVVDPSFREGPEHVILGGRQEGKTRLAMRWLMDAPDGVERVLVVENERCANLRKVQCGMKPSDQRIISFRRLRNGGARRGVQYGIDEAVFILGELLGLKEPPHLLTVLHD